MTLNPFSLFSMQKEVEKREKYKKCNETLEKIRTSVYKRLEGSSLFSYQKEGVAFIASREGRCLVADSMGLGKTAQALTYVKFTHKESTPCLIVCPASLKWTWEREIKQWVDPNARIAIVSGKKPTLNMVRSCLDAHFIIINYDIFADWFDDLAKFRLKVMILDEAHYLKNPKTQRSDAIRLFSQKVPKIIALTGTPITAKPIEFYPTLRILDPKLYPSWWEYATKYCGLARTTIRTKGGATRVVLKADKATNTLELHENLTKTLMIRRKKEDVLKDLPEKTFSNIPVDLDNMSEYRMIESGMKATITEEGYKVTTKVLNKLEELRQATIAGKMEKIYEIIQDFLDNGEKLVVMAIHVKTLDKLQAKFGDQAVRISGNVTGERRKEAEEAFQKNPNARLLLGNIQAAGVGLTLTAASNLLFVEYPWTPAEYNQACDRIHRISQTKRVTIWNLIGKGTVDEDILLALRAKEKVVDAVLDGKEPSDNSIIKTILAKYRGQK